MRRGKPSRTAQSQRDKDHPPQPKEPYHRPFCDPCAKAIFEAEWQAKKWVDKINARGELWQKLYWYRCPEEGGGYHLTRNLQY